MRIKIPLEIVVCAVLILLGLIAYLTIGWGESTASAFLLNQERAMGALDYQSMPRIYALALIVLCAVNILFQCTRRSKEQRAAEEAAQAEKTVDAALARIIRFRTMVTVVAIACYALLLPHVSFLPASAVFLFVMFWTYGQRKLKITIAASLAGAFCLWGLFIKLAALPLGKM